MLCPRCQRSVEPGAAFCGNCGFQLATTQPVQAVEPVPAIQPAVPSQIVPPPTPLYQPAYVAVPATAGQNPATYQALAPVQDHSGKAIACFVLGVLAIPGSLIPIVGIIFGILAIVFGTLSFHSKRRVLAIIGIVLASLALLISLFFWVRNTQELVQEHRTTGKSVGSSDTSGPLQAINTPCYTTKVPATMKITQTSGSCSFLAISSGGAEQQQVKVIQVPGLTAANLATAAKADSANVVNAIPGGTIANQRAASFAGSQSYEVEIKAPDGSAGLISYVYDTTAQGNLVIVLHTQALADGDNYNLSAIESNWSWL